MVADLEAVAAVEAPELGKYFSSAYGCVAAARVARAASLATTLPRIFDLPYFTTDPSRFVVDAGLAQLINANCHVLKISLPAWGRPKNHKHLSLRAARGFLVYPKRVHSF